MGGPHTDTPKGLAGLIIRPEVLPFGIMGERLRKISSGFQSAYQIIPTYACGYDQDGKQINFLEDDRWLEEDPRPLLHTAREFRKVLGTQTSVPTVSIFGYGLKTISRISLKRDALGKIKDAVFATENNGDNSIPELSAFLPGTDFHPVQQHHGTLLSLSNTGRMLLQWIIFLHRKWSSF